MNLLDIIILIFLVIGGLNGLRQGFIKAFANLVGWVVALILAAKYAGIFAPHMVTLSHDPVVQKIAAFAFIVLSIVILTWIATSLMSLILNSIKLGPINRLLGAGFGTSKVLFIVLLTIHGLNPWVESSPYWKQSKLIQLLLPYAESTKDVSKGAVSGTLKHLKSEKNLRPRPYPEPKPYDSTHDQFNLSTQNPFY